MIKASRALSEEINLERLIENLMTILLERAGAQRGLLLRVSDSLIPEIEASAWTSTEGVRVRILKDVPTATDLPLSVLAAVIRTGQEIRTGKPEEFHPFSGILSGDLGSGRDVRPDVQTGAAGGGAVPKTA